jgi:hypothetical protein
MKRLLSALTISLTFTVCRGPDSDLPEAYRTRSGSIILPRGADWLAATENLRNPHVPLGAPAVSAEKTP